MKNILRNLVIIMTLIIISAFNSNGQISITVSWSLCSDTCYNLGADCQYRADVTIYDLCGDEPVLLCNDHNETGCSSTSVLVELDCSCKATSQNPCYLVIATVKKQCILHGVITDVCTGYGQVYKTCDQLLSGSGIGTTWQ